MNKSILIKTHRDNIIDIVRLTNCPKETIYIFETSTKELHEFNDIENVNYRRFVEENVN